MCLNADKETLSEIYYTSGELLCQVIEKEFFDMNDFITQLYHIYCENHKDTFASDEDGELKLNLEAD